MPMCLVHYKAGQLSHEELRWLGPAICESVARALDVPSIPELHLTPSEVEVRFSESGPHDICYHDVGIMIFANDGPDRKSNLKERAAMILENLTGVIGNHLNRPSTTLYVYVMLQNAEYFESNPPTG